jgi:hypothetical protein
MTRDEAIVKAKAKARGGRDVIATSRTAHPAYPGLTVHLIVAKDDKHAWASDEKLVFHSGYPDDLTAAWYDLDCPPLPR